MVYSPLALVIALYLPIEWKSIYTTTRTRTGIWLRHLRGDYAPARPSRAFAPLRAVGTQEASSLRSATSGNKLRSTCCTYRGLGTRVEKNYNELLQGWQ